MHSIHRKILDGFLIASAALLLFAFATPATAKNDPRVPSAKELTLLPPYCAHTQIISKHYGRQQSATQYDATTKPFVDLYGWDFWHLHHYCFGLTAAFRAYRQTSPSGRKGELIRSVGEYDYVIRAVSPSSVILPEVHMQRGISLIKLQRGAEAVLELKRAIQLNPHYVRAYIELSDYYLDTKRKNLALQVLEDGLSVLPDTKSLQKRYAELGGTKTFAQAEVPPQEPATTPEAISAPEAAQPVQEQQQAEPPRIEEKIGTPTNPYCRFCP